MTLGEITSKSPEYAAHKALLDQTMADGYARLVTV
jgi:hypothetical protein